MQRKLKFNVASVRGGLAAKPSDLPSCATSGSASRWFESPGLSTLRTPQPGYRLYSSATDNQHHLQQRQGINQSPPPGAPTAQKPRKLSNIYRPEPSASRNRSLVEIMAVSPENLAISPSRSPASTTSSRLADVHDQNQNVLVNQNAWRPSNIFHQQPLGL